MWKKLKETLKEVKEFPEWEDKKKLDYFRDKLKYSEFMTEFPIVSRYLVVMGQYSNKAFSRMLYRIRTVQHPPADKREKGYIEDQWVRRQADYIRYLWEAYQKNHYSTVEAGYVWEDAYTKLKGEFDDFRNKFKKIEEKTKEEKEKFKADNAKDLLKRLSTGKQTLSDGEMNSLMDTLRLKLNRRRFSNVLEQLCKLRAEIPATAEGFGRGPDDPDVVNKDKPKIRMIEHVNENRMHEIPKNLILDDRTAKELPGFLDSKE
jgi:hypothetical protein